MDFTMANRSCQLRMLTCDDVCDASEDGAGGSEEQESQYAMHNGNSTWQLLDTNQNMPAQDVCELTIFSGKLIMPAQDDDL